MIHLQSRSLPAPRPRRLPARSSLRSPAAGRLELPVHRGRRQREQRKVQGQRGARPESCRDGLPIQAPAAPSKATTWSCFGMRRSRSYSVLDTGRPMRTPGLASSTHSMTQAGDAGADDGTLKFESEANSSQWAVPYALKQALGRRSQKQRSCAKHSVHPSSSRPTSGVSGTRGHGGGPFRYKMGDTLYRKG